MTIIFSLLVLEQMEEDLFLTSSKQLRKYNIDTIKCTEKRMHT